MTLENQTLIERLRTRAEIRKNISSRKSVQKGSADTLGSLFEECANSLEAGPNEIWIDPAFIQKIHDLILKIEAKMHSRQQDKTLKSLANKEPDRILQLLQETKDALNARIQKI